MKYRIILIPAIIISVSLCGCANNKNNTPATTAGLVSQSPGIAESTSKDNSGSAQTEKGQLQEITIEVTPPEGWTAVEGSVLPVQYMKNTASFMVKEEKYTSTTLDAVVDESLKILQKAFDNFAVKGDTESITVDGKDAKKSTFTCEVSKLNMKFQYTYLFAGGKTYVITFGDMAESFDTLSTDYDSILNNIKFKAK